MFPDVHLLLLSCCRPFYILRLCVFLQYVYIFGFELNGPLNVALFHQALNAFVQRQDVFCYKFLWAKDRGSKGEVVVTLDAAAEVPFQILQVSFCCISQLLLFWPFL